MMESKSSALEKLNVYLPLHLLLLFLEELINIKRIEELCVCHQHGLSFKSFPITKTMRACACKGLQGAISF